MTDGTRSQAWLFWLGLGLSLAIHVGVTAYLLSREPQDFGATDLTTTAISVNIESSDILESIQQSAATEAASAPTSTAGEPIPPQEVEPEKAEVTPPPSEPEEVEAQTPPPPTETAEDQAAKEEARRNELAEQAEQQRIAEEALQRAAEAEREKQAAEKQAAEQQAAEKQAAEQRARDKARQLAEEQEAREEREAAREAERKRQTAENQKKVEKQVRKKSGDRVTSAGARGSRGANASTGRVSASQGSLQNYKGTVNAWIARNKPSPPGGVRGTVVILLALSPSGDLISARINSSSGNQTLDQIALAAVRRSSPFPKPPPGSTASQLRFTFPYRFQ